MARPASGTEPPLAARPRRGSLDAGRLGAVADILGRAEAGLSGAEIGRRVGISRAAVWKHVSRLRRDGYRIEGTPSRGYRLLESPARLATPEIRKHLRCRTLGVEIHCVDQVDSTNRMAGSLARGGCPEGTTILADTQTAGKGRLGRSWFSPPARNLYMSVVLRPRVPPARAPQLALVAACAVAAALEHTAPLKPAIKWPNDVLIEGRKVAGILTEMESEGGRVSFVIVGIGVNLNGGEEEFGPALRQTATSLVTATGRTVNRAAFAARLLTELEERYGRYLDNREAELRGEWEAYSCLTGRIVTVAGPQGRLCGRVLGLDNDGALRLRDSRGEINRVLAGDVTLAEGMTP